MDSVTTENVERLLSEMKKYTIELKVLKETTIEKMWLNELNHLLFEYEKYIQKRGCDVLTEIKKKNDKRAKLKMRKA